VSLLSAEAEFLAGTGNHFLRHPLLAIPTVYVHVASTWWWTQAYLLSVLLFYPVSIDHNERIVWNRKMLVAEFSSVPVSYSRWGDVHTALTTSLCTCRITEFVSFPYNPTNCILRSFPDMQSDARCVCVRESLIIFERIRLYTKSNSKDMPLEVNRYHLT
jgi:hypothetical protein